MERTFKKRKVARVLTLTKSYWSLIFVRITLLGSALPFFEMGSWHWLLPRLNLTNTV